MGPVLGVVVARAVTVVVAVAVARAVTGIPLSCSLFNLHLPQILHVYPKKWAIREN